MTMKLKTIKATEPDTNQGKEGFDGYGEMSDACFEQKSNGTFPNVEEVGGEHEDPIEWQDVDKKAPFKLR